MSTNYGQVTTSPAEMAANRARLAESLKVANSGGINALQGFYGVNPSTTPPVPTVTPPTTLYNPSTGMKATPNANVTPAQVQAATSSGYNPISQTPPPLPNSGVTNPITTNSQPVATGNSASPTSNETLAGLLSRYQTALLPTQKMTDISNNIADLETSRRNTNLNLGTEGINAGAKTGYGALIDTQALNKEKALQDEYSIEQNAQQAGAKGLETALGLASTNLGVGTDNTNLLNGQVNASGQSYAARQGSANVLSLSKTYPDAGIQPSDSPDVAAQKASQAPSFIAKYGKSSYQWNPSTGQFELLTSSRLGTTTPGASYQGNPNGNGTSGVSNFGTSSSSGSPVTGSIVDYLNSKGQPSDFNSRATLAASIGIQGYTGTAQQNQQLLTSLQGGSTAPTASAAGNTGASTSLGVSSSLQSLAQQYMQTGVMPAQSAKYPMNPSYGANAVLATVKQIDPNFNPATAKAGADTIGSQQEYLSNVRRSFNTANDNLNSIISFMTTNGINTASNVPIINQLNNKIKSGITDPGQVAAFNSALTGLRAEYSQVLARGGARSVSTDQEATNLIPNNLTPVQLQQVADRLNIEGSNAISEAQKEIDRLSGKITPTAKSGDTKEYNGAIYKVVNGNWVKQ